MTTHRAQQLRAAALIDSGATAEEIAEVFGWTAKPPPRIEPERSGAPRQQKSDKKALTRAQKCAIIVKKAIRRHVCRKIKKIRRTKIMKTYAFYMTAETGEQFALCENGWGIGSTYTVNATTAGTAADIFAANVDIDLTGSEFAAEIAPERIAERPHDFTPLPIW